MSRTFSNFEMPPSLTLTTGGEEERTILDSRDIFFDRVLGHLGLWAAHKAFITYETRALSIVSEALIPAEKIRRSDDWLHEMIVFDEAVAGVLDRRDGYNYHQLSFMVSEPSENVLERIHLILHVSGPKPTQIPS